jgi:hypothetical protein
MRKKIGIPQTKKYSLEILQALLETFQSLRKSATGCDTKDVSSLYSNSNRQLTEGKGARRTVLTDC